MSINEKKTKTNRLPYILVDSNYELQGTGPYNILLVDIAVNSFIQLPDLADVILGYYVWIKRLDDSDAVLTIDPGLADNIFGPGFLGLSAYEGVCLVADKTSGNWYIQEGFNVFTTSVRDLDGESADPAGQIVYNNNPGAELGEGLYYSDGTSWNLITNSGSATVTTEGFIIGDGSPGDPIKLTDGNSDKQIIQWNDIASEWRLAQGEVSNTAFVDENGDDATSELNNPFKPYSTIIQAKIEAELTGDPYLIYVRSGSYVVPGNLVAPDISYYFEPGAIITCTNTPFSWTGGDPVLATFYVQGSGQFISDAVNLINFSGNVTYAYMRFQSLTSTSGVCITLNSITEVYINVVGSIVSGIGDAVRLQAGTGSVTANYISGANAGVACSGGVGTWTVKSDTITSSLGYGYSCTSASHTNVVYVNSITSTTNNAINVSNGTSTVYPTTVNSPAASSVVVSGGTLNVLNFENVASGNSIALAVTGGNVVAMGNRLQGISTTSGTPNIKIQCNLIYQAVSGTTTVFVGNTNGVVDITAQSITGTNAIPITISGTSNPTTRLCAMYVSTTGTNGLVTASSTGSTVDINIFKPIASNATLFTLTRGIINFEFNNITATTTSTLFNCNNSATINIKGNYVSAAGPILTIAAASTTAVNFVVPTCTSSSNSVFSFGNAAGSTLNIIAVNARCTWANVAGHVMVLSGVGTVRLYNCVFSKVNATAKILSSSAPMNVVNNGVFSSNDTSTNITYVGSANFVDANIF